MKIWICSLLLTTAMFAATSGSQPAAAAADATVEHAPEWGGCRWQCSSTGTWYSTSSACRSACGNAFCEPIC